jgi:hypothetical protein
MMDQSPRNFAAGAIDELRGTLSNLSEVMDSGFVVNVAKCVNAWLDAFCDVPHQRLRPNIHGR